MSECASFEEYKTKFAAHEKIAGEGIATTLHIPCPFCAEPDFLVHKILDAEDTYTRGAICKHCGRGSRGIVKHHADGANVEFVQTSGPPAPDWLPPMRRVDG